MASVGPAALVKPFKKPLTNPNTGERMRSRRSEILNSNRRRLENTKASTITPRQKFNTHNGVLTKAIVPRNTPTMVGSSKLEKRRKTW